MLRLPMQQEERVVQLVDRITRWIVQLRRASPLAPYHLLPSSSPFEVERAFVDLLALSFHAIQFAVLVLVPLHQLELLDSSPVSTRQATVVVRSHLESLLPYSAIEVGESQMLLDSVVIRRPERKEKIAMSIAVVQRAAPRWEMSSS